MKKRIVAIAMATAMVLSMAVSAFATEDGAADAAAGVGIVKTIHLDGATFTLEADSIADGAEITITASDMDEEWNTWSITIHPVKDNLEYFSGVLENGQTEKFYTREECMEVLPVWSAEMGFNMAPNTSRTFTLHIPEEFEGWTIDARISGKLSGTYSTDVDPLILVEGEKEPEEQPPVTFSDVAEGDWYYDFVRIAVASHQMVGVGEGKFAPTANFTVAEVLALAAKIDQEANGLDKTEATEPWYAGAVNYCVEKGIVAEDRFTAEDMTRTATRFEVVEVLDKVAGGSITQPINNVPDGFIPDVAESDTYGPVIYKWYRAGLLTGVGEYRFAGETEITRGEIAGIVCRLSNMVPHAEIK